MNSRGFPAGPFEQRISAAAERVAHSPESCATYHVNGAGEHFDYVEHAYGELMTLIGDAYRGGVSVERIGAALGWSDDPAEKVRLFLRRQGYVIPPPKPPRRPRRVVTAEARPPQPEAPTKAQGVTLWNGGKA